MPYAQMTDLIGKILTNIDQKDDDERVVFTCDDGSIYEMYHTNDCCESVYLADVCGNWDNLLNSPIIEAFETTNTNDESDTEKAENVLYVREQLREALITDPEYITMRQHEEQADSLTWTFYRLATAKGDVVLRWIGESNGYYGESVDLHLLESE